MGKVSTSGFPVALWLSVATEKNRGIIRGLAEFAQAHRDVRLYRFGKGRPLNKTALTLLGIRGVIAAVQSTEESRTLRALDLPFVNITTQMRLPGITTIRTDDEAVGRLAAGFFHRRGFRHVAYCGDVSYEGSELRKAAMRRASGVVDGTFHHHDVTLDDLLVRHPCEARKNLARWLRRLPKPVGIFVLSDDICAHLVDLCGEAGFAIPVDVALLGTNVDEARVAVSSMPISSIELNTREIGRRAGELLVEIIRGRRDRPEEVLVPPLQIVSRRSTERWALDDPVVARAVDYIRDHATESIAVGDVMRAVACARRGLEMRFRTALNRSIYGEIQRQRFERAVELLAESERTMSEIAYEAGFGSTRHLCVAFRTRLGTTPGTVRRKLLAGRLGPGFLDHAFA